MIFNRLTFVLCAALFLLFSCADVGTISETEINSFIKSIDASIQHNQRDFIDNSISYSVIQDEAKIKGILKDRVGVALKLSSMITSEVFSSGEFVLTKKERINDKKFRLTYRLLSESTFTYYDFDIKKVWGNIKIIDVYFYDKGITLGEFVLNHLRGIGEDYAIDYAIQEWTQEINRKLYVNNLKEAKKLYKALLKQYDADDFSFLTFKLNYAYSVGDTVLVKKMLTSINQYRPKEKRFVLRNKLVYYNYSRKEHNRRREIIDSLKIFVGNDYVLNYYIGDSYLKEKNYNKAAAVFNELIESNPNYSLAFEGEIQLLVMKGNYQQAIALFKEFKRNFSVTISPKIFFKDYPDFLSSKEFKEVF